MRRNVKAPKRFEEGNFVNVALLTSKDGELLELSNYKTAIIDPFKYKWNLNSGFTKEDQILLKARLVAKGFAKRRNKLQ